jgi:hypothetical protein
MKNINTNKKGFYMSSIYIPNMAEVSKHVYSSGKVFSPKISVKQLEYLWEKQDPKQLILESIGDTLNCFKNIFGNRVMVAIAPSPLVETTLHIPDSATSKKTIEGRWQGKVGLILKLGTAAFKQNPRYPDEPWPGYVPQVGDWIYFKTASTWEAGIQVERTADSLVYIPVRYVYDTDVVGDIDNIEAIY